MTLIEEIMTREVISLNPEDSIYDAVKVLRTNRISGAPVVKGGEVVGILSETDILKQVQENEINTGTILPSPFDVIELPLRTKFEMDKFFKKIEKTASSRVQDIMTMKPIVISSKEDINKGAKVMWERNINRLPVVENGKLVGIVTRGDIIGAL